MAIITCPECGQHPVSDRAPTCPRCGCPIAAIADSKASADPSPESSARRQPPTIREVREAQLEGFNAILQDSTEFPDASIYLSDYANLVQLASNIHEWCEELDIGGTSGLRMAHVEAMGRLSKLKSLDIWQSELDDEGLLRLSKLTSLRKLKVTTHKGRSTMAGWLQLAKLSRLEYLELPVMAFPGTKYDFDREGELRQELQRRLPNTIVK